MCFRYFVKVGKTKIELTQHEFWNGFPMYCGIHYKEEGNTAFITADLDIGKECEE